MAQPRPRFTRNSGQRRYLRHGSRLQRCTSRAGHYAGRVDARTARERGYKPRPQEPHSPHRTAVTGRRPSIGEIRNDVTETVTYVKRVCRAISDVNFHAGDGDPAVLEFVPGGPP